MGVAGAVGHVVEFAGPAIEALVDGGAHDDLQHDDRGRRTRRHDRAGRHDVRLDARAVRARRRATSWTRAIAAWRELRTDEGATFDREITVDCDSLSPLVTWGTNPGQVVSVTDACPTPDAFDDAGRPRGRRARPAVHGPRARHADAGHRARPRVHRLVHELAHRRPARGRRGRARPARRRPRVRDGRPRFGAGQGAGRGRGPRRGLPRRRLRLARRRAARCASA